MLGLYFSGTGNTEYVVKKFTDGVNGANIQTQTAADEGAVFLSITAPEVSEVMSQHETIVFGYPVYFSDTPKIVKDFIAAHKAQFANKKVFVIATMGMISGDGAGVGARAIKKHSGKTKSNAETKCKAKIIGGLHIKMPDSIADEKAFANQDNPAIIAKADAKIEKAIKQFQSGKPTRNGLSFFHRLGGLFMQRLWLGGKTKRYHPMPKIDICKCNGCGLCTQQCPTKNLELCDGKKLNGNLETRGGKITQCGKCTLCYRCVNICPQKALTILGKQVYKQNILVSEINNADNQ